MKRDILTQRIENGWQHPEGRVRATRDQEALELGRQVKAGEAVVHGITRFSYWDVELLDESGNVIDTESVNTLADADDQAWDFKNRIDEGRA
jgi:hypothetical protein